MTVASAVTICLGSAGAAQRMLCLLPAMLNSGGLASLLVDAEKSMLDMTALSEAAQCRVLSATLYVLPAPDIKLTTTKGLFFGLRGKPLLGAGQCLPR